MMNKQFLLQALKNLEAQVREGNHRALKRSICVFLEGGCGLEPDSKPLNKWLVEAFQDWPEFSGDSRYPVFSRGDGGTAYEQFEAAKDLGTFWDVGTAYGRARHRLLTFLLARAGRELRAPVIQTAKESAQAPDQGRHGGQDNGF